MKKSLLKFALGIAAISIGVSSYAQVYTFTNCGATGRLGPTQAQVNTAYTGPNPLAGNVTINTQGIQEWTVPVSGGYRIEARGAQGGDAAQPGGQGANISGDFNLTAGQVLRIVVGQEGINSNNNTNSGNSAGGGGGSYVIQAPYNTTPSILAIAGGGGGAGVNAGASVAIQVGIGGSATGDGLDGKGSTVIAGGTNGSGGGYGTSCGASSGAGFTGNSVPYGGWATEAFAFVNGAMGADQTQTSSGRQVLDGGFGGGGAGAYGGGGGGGYSGGGCGHYTPRDGGGGGGGSFNSGTNQTNTAAVNTGMGQVIITRLCSPTIAPTITCPANVTVNNDAGQCDAVVTYTAPTATDDCGAVATTLTSGPASGSTFPVGTTTVTYSATNSQGTVSCSFTVTVVDAEAPALTCPANITVNNDAGQCDAVVTYTAPVGTDNCSGVTTALTSGPASGSTFPLGTTTVTYTATDAASNSTPCSFTVTVVDAEAPTITCGGNVASCDTVVSGIAPTGTSDNCTGEYVTYALSGATTGTGANDASGSTFNVGTTTIWYHVTDSAGNQDSCSFDVVVHPLPTIVLNTFNNDTMCLADNPQNLPSAAPSGGTFSGPGVSGSTFDPSTAGVGTHYVTYSYTDANSCTNSDSTMIVVESCVGINENASLAGVRIYPNPTNGFININLGNHNGSVNYSISTIEGRLVTQQRNVATNQMTIDLNNESKGIYLLRIEDATSSKVYKIIKE